MAELTLGTLTQFEPTTWLSLYPTPGMSEVWGAAQWASGVRAPQQTTALTQFGQAMRGLIT